jgi:hypothetical protein
MLMLRLFLAGSILVLSACNGHKPAEVSLIHNFDNPLSRNEFYLGQLKQGAYSVQTGEVRSGSGALKITNKPDNACGEDLNCLRNEVRIHAKNQLPLGTRAWYGFSFKVDGRVARTGSIRTVIGQWKEQTGGNPFVAQRYDNGVFHVTVQDNDSLRSCRRAITAGADAAGQVFPEQSPALLGLAPEQRESEVKQQLLRQLNSENGNLLRKLSFEPEVKEADCETSLKIEAFDLLPDPYESWVDMAYMIFRDPQRKQSEVEVYANGKLVGRASGPIGNHDAGGKQYFKFGIYGDLCSFDPEVLRDKNVSICRVGEMNIYIDNFRRGTSREEADPAVFLKM